MSLTRPALVPLVSCLLLIGGCSDCGLSIVEDPEVRELGVVPVGARSVTFAVGLINDHLGWHLTAEGGGGRTSLPNGIHFPEDEWRPKPVITLADASGSLDLTENHNPEWYRIGVPYADREDAESEAASIEVEHCEGSDAVVYRYVGNAYESTWKAVTFLEDQVVHDRAQVRDAPTCAEALAAQPVPE